MSLLQRYLSFNLFLSLQIQVVGPVTCRLGALLLTANNVKVLGGSVQLLEGNSFWNVLHQTMYVDPLNIVLNLSLAYLGRKKQFTKLKNKWMNIDQTLKLKVYNALDQAFGL